MRLILAILALQLSTAGALAQSSPNLIYGQVPTPAQWNSYFAGKMDYTGQPPCLTSGCTFTGAVSVPAFIAAGAPPTASGTCTVTSQIGGNTAGQFTATGAGCSNGNTVILTFATTAPNGWACDAEDRTTTNDTVQQSASTTTTATFKTSSIGPSDVVSFKCVAY